MPRVVALNQCSEILRQGHNVTILTADTGHHSKIFDEFLGNNPKIKLVELPLEQIHKTGDKQIITQFLSQNGRTKSSCKNAGTRNRTAGAQHRRIQTDISAIQPANYSINQGNIKPPLPV